MMRFSAFILATLIFNAVSSEAPAAVKRKYCPLPEPIYKDGISSVSFGKGGWTYGNAAQWKGNIHFRILQITLSLAALVSNRP